MNMELFASIIIGYLFGCIQSAFLIGKIFGKLDIGDHGSGNAGASNITATMGWKYGIIVGLVDILKGLLAVLAIKGLFLGRQELAYLSGMMAVIGHIFPFFMKFRGGKGVAALVGMMFGVDWKLGVLFALLVAIPALLTDYIVAGSFTTFIALPIVTYLRGLPTWFLMLSLLLAALCFYLHRGNIQRILKKDEVKISSVMKRKSPVN